MCIFFMLRRPPRSTLFPTRRSSDLLEGLQDVVAGDTEMIGITNTDPAGAGFFRFVHGDAIRLRADDQTKTVVAIDRSEERRVGKECRSRWSVERLKKKREDRDERAA